MSPAKKAAKKAPAKKSAKKTPARKSPAKKTAKKAAKKSTSRRGSSSSAATANVVVASKVRDAVRNGDIRMASDFVDGLNTEVSGMISKAVDRAKSNGRGTVRTQDL